MAAGTRVGKIAFAGVIALIGLGFVGALVWTWFARDDLKPGRVVEERPASAAAHPVAIRTPGGMPLVDSGQLDAAGKPVMVGCATCHDTREPNYETRSGAALKDFHQGLSFAHGNQSCLSCHNAKDYDTLKQADGRALEFSQSMMLCAQCHGPQFRDYQNGSHGGMQGHWDLTRGGRTRNTCTDCHDPHHPAYPQVMPVFPPKPVRGEKVTPHAAHP
jgi:hypothetical protein